MNTPSSKTFEFSCPSCLRPIKAGLKAAGKPLPCPGCGKEITVPTPEDAEWDAVHDPPSGDEYGLIEPGERTKYTPVIAPTVGEEANQTDLGEDTNNVSSPSQKPDDGSKESNADEDDKFKISERPKLPPHPMTTGIFSMFADASAIMWFVTLTLSFAIVIGLLTVPTLAFAGKIEGGMLADTAYVPR